MKRTTKRRTKQEKERRAKLWEIVMGLCGRRDSERVHCYHDPSAEYMGHPPLCLDDSCPILKLVEELLEEVKP